MNFSLDSVDLIDTAIICQAAAEAEGLMLREAYHRQQALDSMVASPMVACAAAAAAATPTTTATRFARLVEMFNLARLIDRSLVDRIFFHDLLEHNVRLVDIINDIYIN